jgi:uncharacterized membrane protein
MPNEIANDQNKKKLADSQNQPLGPYQGMVSIRGEIFQGPFPDPEMLMRYKNADSSFPERIVKMAEKHNYADVGIKKSFIFSNTVIPILGQIFTFLLGAGSLYTCLYLANKGLTGGAIAAVVAGFAPIIINALKSFRQNGQSKQNDDLQSEKI